MLWGDLNGFRGLGLPHFSHICVENLHSRHLWPGNLPFKAWLHPHQALCLHSWHYFIDFKQCFHSFAGFLFHSISSIVFIVFPVSFDFFHSFAVVFCFIRLQALFSQFSCYYYINFKHCFHDLTVIASTSSNVIFHFQPFLLIFPSLILYRHSQFNRRTEHNTLLTSFFINTPR